LKEGYLFRLEDLYAPKVYPSHEQLLLITLICLVVSIIREVRRVGHKA